MKRFLGLGVIFLMGMLIGIALIRSSHSRPIPDPEAKQKVLAVLDLPPNSVSAGDTRIVGAVKKIEPAVVNIDTISRTAADESDNDPLGLGREVRGKGSGVILSSDGYIVTNRHVIEEANRIRVTLPNGQWHYARLIGHDPQTDLAVIRIDAANLPSAELGDSDKLQVGEWSIAVGNPLGLGSTITVGVISALNRRNLQIEEGRQLDGAIQTDAAINRGNSGGALANINGQLIGINTAILSSGPTGGSIGLGFAIPTNTMRRVVKEIILYGRVKAKPSRPPWLGVAFQPVPTKTAQMFNLEQGQGVAIQNVLSQSPASLAGVKAEDIILAIDNKPIGDVRDVREAVIQRKAGEDAMIELLRPSLRRKLTVKVRVQSLPEGVRLPLAP